MKADVLQLVQDLSAGVADPETSERYYADAVIDLGQQEFLVNVSLLQHGIDLGNFDAPESTLAILAVLYGDTQLTPETQKTIEAVDPYWRERVGRPQAYVTETEGDQRFRLWPAPDQPSQQFLFLSGSPMGKDYPTNALGVIHTEFRADVPVWLELPVALRILAREFARESIHQDLAYAKACAELADMLLKPAMPEKMLT